MFETRTISTHNGKTERIFRDLKMHLDIRIVFQWKDKGVIF